MVKRNRLKRLNRILNVIIGSFLGVFIGHSLYRYWDYKSHPGLYDWQSAPWYSSILIYGGVTAVILLVAVVIKFIIRKRIR